MPDPVTPTPQRALPPGNHSPITVSSRGPSPPIFISSLSPSPVAALPSHLQPVYRQLTSSAGLNLTTFRQVWKTCEGCNNLVPRCVLKDHVCDLTMLEMD